MHGIRRQMWLALSAAGAPPAARGGGGGGPGGGGRTWRGWHFSAHPPPDADPPRPAPPKPAGPPAAARDPRRDTRPPELVELERLRQRVEDLRGIAVMRPTEANVRRYMELESKVVAQASTFADVAQRVAWTTPELDPSLQGRPVNAKALEVFEAQQLG